MLWRIAGGLASPLENEENQIPSYSYNPALEEYCAFCDRRMKVSRVHIQNSLNVGGGLADGDKPQVLVPALVLCTADASLLRFVAECIGRGRKCDHRAF